MNLKIFSLFITCILFTCFTNKSFSQAGNTGSWPPDYEILEKCVDSADLGTNYISYYELQTHRAGFAVTIATYRSNGSSFTVPAGKITMGMCPQSVTVVKDSIKDIVVLELCDETTLGTIIPFWRIVQRTYWPTTGAGTVNVLATIDKLGATYTPSGSSNIYSGPCMTYDYPTSDLVVELTSNTTYTGPMASWAVSNVGLTTITMAIGAGSQVNLFPGETRECAWEIDWSRHIMRVCPQIVVNATGGTAHVFYRKK